MIKHALMKVIEPGFKPGKSIGSATRDRVQALISSILISAVNEFPPLAKTNVCRDIRFSERRKGKKKPRHLGSHDECLKFLEAARQTGFVQYLICFIFLSCGLRKQELAALRWCSIDLEAKTMEICEKLEQCSNLILPGTKAGVDSTRTIPISADLSGLLKEHRSASNFNKDEDFVISNPTGEHLTARQISRIIEIIRVKAGLDISAHGLRHSMGRLFVANGGSIKVLQAVMGHSSSGTTDIYSNLSGKQIAGFGEVINLKKDPNG